ncbi:cerberus-like [Protopterus annectens]|uniref:cerberus-like n=1 Tax=Protopterus annectens TaxID=7888 RepID=UPI001CF97371|nr:cerberus-like [Protopterus annectens]
MWHLLFLLLVTSTLAETVQGKEKHRKTRTEPHFTLQEAVPGIDISELTGLEFVSHYKASEDHRAVLEEADLSESQTPKTERRRKVSQKVPRSESSLTELELEGQENTEDKRRNFSPIALVNAFGETKSTPPSSSSNMAPSQRKNAKMFWHHFMFRRGSTSQELVLPIKTNEVQQETCQTLPFSQSIVHKNCEKVVIQNNLCFGRCSSFHVPGPEDRLYTFCSHCLPTKFTLSRLQLNCTGNANIVKVIMLVEECKCEIQKGVHPSTRLQSSELKHAPENDG